MVRLIMRTIRVKKENQSAIIAGLQQAGFTAEPTDAPLAEVEYEMNAFSSSKNWTFNSLVGMAGILTDASGHQAHKVISTLKEQGTIN